MILINEHNEAYLEIVRFFNNTDLQEKVIFLHIDEHSDFRTPLVSENLLVSNKIEDASSLTYNELRISDFILPLFYKGYFSQIIWLCNHNVESSFHFKIDSEQSNSDKIYLKAFQVSDEETDSFSFLKCNVDNSSLDVGSSKIIMSIDLDYFSCDDRNGEAVRVEISEDEYNRYLNDVNHVIRSTYGSRARIYREEGRFFLNILEYVEKTNRVNDYKTILSKIENFKFFLKVNNINPIETLICKSSISGYIDEEKCDFIINHLNL